MKRPLLALAAALALGCNSPASGLFVVMDVSPRFFSLLTKRNREAYLSRTQFIWPIQGPPLGACEKMLDAMCQVLEEIERQRQELGV